MSFKYLVRISEFTWVMDHRVVPEARAMFAAMVSRIPQGGIAQRYREVVVKVAQHDNVSFKDAEDKLTTYHSHGAHALHPIVQKFFDTHVANYGHGSVKELTGSPLVFIEGISWWLAYLLFDNPLVCGQEASTRAVMHDTGVPCAEILGSTLLTTEEKGEFRAIHTEGMALTKDQIELWKVELRRECPDCLGKGCPTCNGTGKKYPWMNDPQAFRPAFDKARWALPGTYSTAVSLAVDIRTIGKILANISEFATQDPSGIGEIYRSLVATYEYAMPGMAGMWISEEGVRAHSQPTPMHIKEMLLPSHPANAPAEREDEVVVLLHQGALREGLSTPKRGRIRTYVDPSANHEARITLEFDTTIACLRDWHRHRTAYPWSVDVLTAEGGVNAVQTAFQDSAYVVAPGEDSHLRTNDYLGRCYNLRHQLLERAKTDKKNAAALSWFALLACPLGTMVRVRTRMGLRDAMYMLELRKYAHGANFEYKYTASALLDQVAALSKDTPFDQFPRDEK